MHYLLYLLLLSYVFICIRSCKNSESAHSPSRGKDPRGGDMAAATGKLESLIASGATGEKLVKIDLSGCGLEELPIEEILRHKDTLELLNLGGNRLSKLPNSISELKRLRVLFFAGNAFEYIPEALGKLEHLYMLSFKGCKLKSISETALSSSIEWLILTDNELTSLPKTIGSLTGLRKCMLAGNKLSCLPEEMSACRRMELIRISSNLLTELPQWLISLPRLSWIAFASNPFCSSPVTASSSSSSSGSSSSSSSSGSSGGEELEEVDYAEVDKQEILGQGASGEVYRSIWKGQEVAMKMFRGAATSDGLPEDEVAAGVLLGKHANTIELLAKIKGAPEDRLAVLLPLIPAFFTVLGDPPNFDTCTRDTYPADKRFPPKAAVLILRAITDVCVHMHAQFISHGDLYAHNILINLNDESSPLTKLTDFGAASILSHLSPAQTELIERIEVRAVGCLIEELGDRLEEGPERVAMKEKLQALVAACTAEDVLSRPTFAALRASIDSLL